MKRVFLLLIMSLFTIGVYAKDIKELIVSTTPPMHCENCENKIKKGDLRFVKGIKKIETNIPEQKVTITYDSEKTNPNEIEKAFNKTGYQIKIITPDKVTVIEAPEASECSLPSNSCVSSCCNKK